MRHILHSYKLRLTNLSGGNRTLRLGRLSSSRDMDMKDWHLLEDKTAEQLLERLLAGRDLTLIQRLNPRFEATNLADRRLNRIFRTANTLAEETGSYDLQIGYPFVEGRFLDGTICRAPLLLFPVRLLRNFQGKPRWKLEVLKDEEVRFNRTFLLAYEQFSQLRLPPEIWELEIARGRDWLNWLNELYDRVKKFELELNFNARLYDRKLWPFPDLKKAELEHFRTGVLTCQPYAVLGIFPQSDSALLQDYEIIEQQADRFKLDQFFQAPSLPQPADSPYIKEENRFFVTPVDHSQEDAILKVKQGKSLVVHGPPGTGKSQVIVNMVADALAHGKKVLVVSQKRAALDVVYKRLAALKLHPFAVLVHDYRHDRGPIYKQIKRQIDQIPVYQQTLKDLNLTKWEHDYRRLSREVDQLNRQFEDLYQALIKQREHGLTVHDLYLRCDAQQNRLPLQALAKQLDDAQLEAWLDKVRLIREYRDLLDPTHPWQRRLSFRNYLADDRPRLLTFIDGLPSQLQGLHTTYKSLSENLGSRLLDIPLNQERIDAFSWIDAQLKDSHVAIGINLLAQERMRVDTIAGALDKLEKGLHQMDQRQYLEDRHWSHYGNLIKHQKHYKSLQKAPLRLISIPFQRAKWFFNKVLESKEVELTASTFKSLSKEIKHYHALHQWYARYHEKPFFEDFPLLDSQAEKWHWIQQKRLQLEAYTRIKDISYFPKVKPRFLQGQFDGDRWTGAMEQISALNTFNRRLTDIQREWRQFLHAEQIIQLTEGIKDTATCTPFIDNLRESVDRDFEDLRDLDRFLFSLSSVEQDAMAQLQELVHTRESEESIIQQIRHSIYFYWIEQAERQSPILAEVSSRTWPRKEREFVDKLAQRQQKVTELITRSLKEQIVSIIEYNRLKNPVTYREIYHQVTKQRLIWSIRKLVAETWEKGLQQLAPCWLASPESAAAIFPMKADFFDLVIMDEASQCFVERALPVILRGKQAVIAGDSQQLQPTNLYQVRYEEAGEDAFVEEQMALEVESILDLAKNTFPETRLNWHYRSQAQELINFSNQAFYEGKLQVIPPAQVDTLNEPALEWIAVEGMWQQNRNEPEAERVIELIEELIQRTDRPSIGIVTFNYHQQELIRDLLDRRLEALAIENETRYEQLQQSLHQYEGEEFTGLFVKNIENVQGDERDVIIFSVGYGYNEKGRLSTNFGLLNQKGGENRLNVAITRARKKIYVVCSFQPGELQVDESTHPGPRLFRDYLRYVKAVSDRRHQDALRLLNAQHHDDITYLPENVLADQVQEALQTAGYEVLRHYGETNYKLDIVARKAGEASYSLAVECEGAYYFSGRSAKEREIYRHALLKAKGWQYRRIWARNWWLGRRDIM